MRIRPRPFFLVLLIPVLTACAADPPIAAATAPADAKFEPAPMSFAPYPPRLAVLGSPVPPKMPPGTGAVPISGSSFRGAVVTGFGQSF
jgi:hypothetical protein